MVYGFFFSLKGYDDELTALLVSHECDLAHHVVFGQKVSSSCGTFPFPRPGRVSPQRGGLVNVPSVSRCQGPVRKASPTPGPRGDLSLVQNGSHRRAQARLPAPPLTRSVTSAGPCLPPPAKWEDDCRTCRRTVGRNEQAICARHVGQRVIPTALKNR